MTEVTGNVHTNFFMVNPTYQIEAKFPDPPGHPMYVSAKPYSQHVYLAGLSADESKVFFDYFIRTGAREVNVVKNEPIFGVPPLAQETTDE